MASSRCWARRPVGPGEVPGGNLRRAFTTVYVPDGPNGGGDGGCDFDGDVDPNCDDDDDDDALNK